MTQPATPYGSDVWIGPNADGILDLDPSVREVSGIDVLAQSIVLRQTTATGSAIDAPADCIDIRSWISKGMTVAKLSQLKSIIQGQLLRDQRIVVANVGLSFSFATSVMTITEVIQSTLGPFTLTLNVSSVSVTMLIST